MVYFDNRVFRDDELYELYILKKYLTKHCGEENSITLIKEHADSLDDLAKSLGKEDIEFFCLYFMSDTFVVKDSNVARQLSKGHYELWDIANEIFVEDRKDKAAIIEPRGKNLNAMPRSYRNIA